MLTAEQQRFIESTQNTFLQAVPGAGKTTTILHKLKTLYQRKYAGQKLLYLVFNTSLQQDIKTKLQVYPSIHVWTIHAFALKLFTQIYGKTQLIKIFKHPLKLSEQFDEIFESVKKALRTGKIILPYKYIVIDEAQDMSPIQIELIAAMLESHSQLHTDIVGDINQAIYQFRGVDTNYLDAFLHRFHFQRMYLTRSFRLGPNTAKLLSSIFNTTIRSGSAQRDTVYILQDYLLKGLAILQSPIKYWLFQDAPMESQYKSKSLTQQAKTLIQGQDLAILATTNFQIKQVKNKLTQYNIPYSVLGTLPDDIKQQLEVLSRLLQEHSLDQQHTMPLPDPQINSPLLQNVINFFKQGDYFSATLKLYEVQQHYKRLKQPSCVNLATIHQAKGLEFGTTIVFWSKQDMVNIKTSQQFQNMLYVALSRHRNTLIILLEQGIAIPATWLQHAKLLRESDLRQKVPKQQSLI